MKFRKSTGDKLFELDNGPLMTEHDHGFHFQAFLFLRRCKGRS